MVGWISKRAMEGQRIGGTKGQSMADKGPLVKIIRVRRFARSMFDTDWVEFACGHDGPATSGAQRGRCRKCKRPPVEPPKGGG